MSVVPSGRVASPEVADAEVLDVVVVAAALVKAGRVVAIVTEAAEVVRIDSVLMAPTLTDEEMEKTAAEVLDDLFLQADLDFLELVGVVLLPYGAEAAIWATLGVIPAETADEVADEAAVTPTALDATAGVAIEEAAAVVEATTAEPESMIPEAAAVADGC